NAIRTYIASLPPVDMEQEALAAAREAFIDNTDETLFFDHNTDNALYAAIRAYLEALSAPSTNTDYDGLVERLKERGSNSGYPKADLYYDASEAIIALQGERDRLRAEYERAILQQLELRKAAEKQLGELLAIIHR